jgi:hypothetical protein
MMGKQQIPGNTSQPRVKIVDRNQITQWAEEAKAKKQAKGALDMDINALFSQVKNSGLAAS